MFQLQRKTIVTRNEPNRNITNSKAKTAFITGLIRFETTFVRKAQTKASNRFKMCSHCSVVLFVAWIHVPKQTLWSVTAKEEDGILQMFFVLWSVLMQV